MLGKTYTYARIGLLCEKVIVEVDVKPGVPLITISGLASREVKEARERIRPAVENCGFEFPVSKITINLSPVETIKIGSHYDLSITVALLIATESITDNSRTTAIFGEVNLSGEIKGVRGILPMVLSAINDGFERIIVPRENLEELRILGSNIIFPVNTVSEVVDLYNGGQITNESDNFVVFNPIEQISDFSDIKGQEELIRAFQISSAGNHHLLIIGPPGTGKSMCGSRLPGIMPALTIDELMEINMVYSASNQTKFVHHVTSRPFRAPHNSASSRAMIGGGPKILPGEVSLAHRGILFLDEFLEFKSDTLQALRTIIEKREVYISLRNGSAVYPADFLLIAACNPCPCGNYGIDGHHCSCNNNDVKKYRRKLKNPLTDRIDLQLKIGRVPYSKLTEKQRGISSEQLKNTIKNVREVQRLRYTDEKFSLNSDIPSDKLSYYCPMTSEAELLLSNYAERFILTARSTHKIVRISRTIADLSDNQIINTDHIEEALNFRVLENEVL